MQEMSERSVGERDCRKCDILLAMRGSVGDVTMLRGIGDAVELGDGRPQYSHLRIRILDALPATGVCRIRRDG